MRVVLYGSRPDGHAGVVFDAVRSGGGFDVVGLVDDYPENHDRQIDGLQVVGTRDDLARLAGEGIEGVLLGFGAARGRDMAVDAVERAGLSLPVLIHSAALVSESANLAAGVQVLPRAAIGPNVQLGRGVLINTGTIVEHDVTVGDFTVIGPGTVLAGRAKVGRLVEIGAGAVVLPDIEIGEGAIVGAGAVVIRSVADGQTATGVPARPASQTHD